MPFPLPPARIATLLGVSTRNVEQNWPHVETALQDLGIATELVCIAACSTIRVECPSFTPQSEKFNGNMDEYFKRYDGRADLGNTEPGDGCRFRGRGYIQITGRANYAHYAKELGVDLVCQPALALDPVIAAHLFAHFFHEHDVDAGANRQDWKMVRERVNGGLNDYAEFLSYVNRLKANAADATQGA